MSAAFVLTLDLEMAWGSWRSTRFDYRVFAKEPNVARTLDRFATDRRMPFTWAVVGAIEGLNLDALRHLPDHVPITQAFGETYQLADPAPSLGGVRRHPTAWFSPGLIPELAKSKAGHEIASHTFFHSLPVSTAAMISDLACMRRALPGVEIATLVFPRDRIDRSVTQSTTLLCYRGPVDRPWFGGRGRPYGAGKVIHFLEQAMGIAAPLASVNCGNPTVVSSSAIFTLRHGVRRHIPASIVMRRIRASLDRAIRENGVFHLWTHPWNLAIPNSDALDLLLGALDIVADRRNAGDIDVVTMGDLASRECLHR